MVPALNCSSVLAQIAWGGGGLIGFLKLLIIILACVAIVFVITKAMGVEIPKWVIQVAVILIAAVVGILAIGFLASL